MNYTVQLGFFCFCSATSVLTENATLSICCPQFSTFSAAKSACECNETFYQANSDPTAVFECMQGQYCPFTKFTSGGVTTYPSATVNSASQCVCNNGFVFAYG